MYHQKLIHVNSNEDKASYNWSNTKSELINTAEYLNINVHKYCQKPEMQLTRY
jgi:hypothetical protein